jgi:hypothetical protein
MRRENRTPSDRALIRAQHFMRGAPDTLAPLALNTHEQWRMSACASSSPSVPVPCAIARCLPSRITLCAPRRHPNIPRDCNQDDGSQTATTTLSRLKPVTMKIPIPIFASFQSRRLPTSTKLCPTKLCPSRAWWFRTQMRAPPAGKCRNDCALGQVPLLLLAENQSACVSAFVPRRLSRLYVSIRPTPRGVVPACSDRGFRPVLPGC